MPDVPADDKTVAHERAAHQARNWVRLTYDCNDRCVFCLDSNTHDGTNRAREEVKAQILDGRRKGAQRLILSGGEPTIHPDFPAFVRLGRLAGYERIQTVTNGRMFAYGDFLSRCLDEGLGEITFSIHGPNARVHDALVGTPGAFEQEVRGLRNALDDGRPIVNIDVCVNRGNVRVLPEILETFYAMGVREFDLLHVIPFGRAYTEGKETLFYDLEAMRPSLVQAFAWAHRPDVHLWLNRFPVEHLEGFESLIQDPYKLGDEVRGRKEEYAQLLERGMPLDCREPDRCRHCYIEPLCDRLDEVRDDVARSRFDVLRVDPRAEASQPPVYGGDPASAKRSAQSNQVVAEAEAGAHRRLPVLGASPVAYPTLAEHLRRGTAERVWVVESNVEAARAVLAKLAAGQEAGLEVELELDDVGGLRQAVMTSPNGTASLDGHRLVRVLVTTGVDALAMLALPGVEVVLALSRDVSDWLQAQPGPLPARLVLRQPSHTRLTTSAEQDVELKALVGRLESEVPIEDVPPCIAGERARPPRRVLDTAMMTPEGELEIFRYARRFVATEYRVKSLRCRPCRHYATCTGLHVNYVRAHGFAAMQPVP